MSVSLTPSSALGFNRPLTVLVKRTLTVTNNNAQPVAFKVKTTAPKLYCVRPNSGRIEPGESVDVAVMLQPMKEEPPTAAKCKDKFLIQSTLITSEKETLPLHDIWNVPDGAEEAKVHQQKLRVVYLPPEGQTVEEEDESVANQSSFFSGGESRYDTVRQHPSTNGHVEPIPQFNEPEPQTRDLMTHEEAEPAPEFTAAPEEAQEDAPRAESNGEFVITPPSPPPSAPAPLPVFAPAPAAEPEINAELEARYNEAQSEIQRLRALLAAAPDPSSVPTEATGLRRRNRALSDDGSTIAGTDIGTMLEEASAQPEGVPLQVVLIIALGVFITTYLFF